VARLVVVADPVATPSPAPPTPTARPTVSPLSGAKGNVAGRVVVVKIDNTGGAHPQRGVAAADVVYVEPVEFGLTRLAAVYSSRLPREVGPVRSARETDLELFRQYGRVAFVYSGARSIVLRQIARAPIYDLTEVTAPGGFRRSSARPIPFNLFARPDRLLAIAPNAVAASDIGFRFGPPAAGGRPAIEVSARWANARLRFGWSPADKRWLWEMDGRRIRDDQGGRIGASTVIVQYVSAPLSSYRDKFGQRTPLPKTVGSGRALILRDGRAYDAVWNRPSAASGTRWTIDGKDVPLAAGQVWVVLLDRRTPASVR
jgi:hypothetical protein